MTKSQVIVVASTTVVLLLSGCTTAQQDPPTSNATPAEFVMVEDRASVERWAGVVAERKAEINDWYAGWNDATCASRVSAEPACNIMLTAASLMAQTNHLVIAGASDRSGDTYLGPVPSEIKDLYVETIALTATAKDAANTWSDADCSIGDEGECIGLAFRFELAMSDVRLKFEAWLPYL